MSSLSAALHGHTMGCSGAAASRVASCPAAPASARRAAPGRSAAPTAFAPAFSACSGAAGWSAPENSAMLPGLVRLRLSSTGSSNSTLRAYGRGCLWTRPCRRVLEAAAAIPASAAAGLGLASAPPAAASAAMPLVSVSAASSSLPFAASAAAAAAPSLAPQTPRQHRRHLATLARAASGPPGADASTSGGGGGGSGGGKKQKAATAAATQVKAKQPPAATSPAAAAPAPAAAPAVRYSPLHHNIEEFCSRVVLTEGEKRQRLEVIDAVRAGVRRVWSTGRGVELEVFGSFANGLSTWNSDLDLVVTGVSAPDKLTGGYEQNDRARITAKLRKLSEALNRAKQIDIVRQQFIPRARMPILKLWVRNRVCVDVSISDDSGPRAARYMVQQCRAYPPLKPLVLVLKAYLKACRLNEVNTGGLSSYSLTNMVIAHLQEELKAGEDVSDLGETLYTFLLRYGREFDYGTQAVSVASGGVVPKSSLGFAMESARQAFVSQGSYDGAVSWNKRLCVDCPLTGRDVSNGSYRIDLVRDAFSTAAKNLEILAKGRRVTDTSVNYLQALFEVNRVLKRSAEPYEDSYLTVVGRAGEEEGEDLPLSEGTSGPDDDDDIGGDYLQR